MEQQDNFGEVAALDFRSVAFVAALVADRGPQTVTSPGRGAAGAAFALIGAGAADGLQQEGADAAFGIIAGHAGGAAVHHVADAVDGDAGLGDVGGDDDLAQGVRRKGAVLFLRLEFAVKRDAGHALPGSQAPQRVEGAVDFAAPGHENEDVAGIIVVDDALDGFGGLRGDRTRVGL